MTRILITGGAGFIGSNLCDHFVSKNFHVVCLDNFSTGHRINIEHLLAEPNFTLIEGDIRDYSTCLSSLEGCTYVLHQAALGSVPRSINDPITTNDVNISGFLNMLYASKELKIKRFIYAASSSTYGDSKEMPKTEDKIGKPISPYAVTKLVNEIYADVFSKTYGLDTIGLRYFNVFGKRQDPNGAYAAVIPKFLNAFCQGEDVIINGDGEFSRDFTYIKNVVQMNDLALNTGNSEALNQVYNTAFGERNTLNDLVREIKQELARYIDISKTKVIYGPNRIGDIPHSLASIEKATQQLKYNPEYNLQTGLKEYIQWYITNTIKK